MIEQLQQAGSVLFVGSGWGGGVTLLADPLRIISGHDPDDLPTALDAVEQELAAGRTVAGFMSYETGRAFGLTTRDPSTLAPLYWFGVYESRRPAGPPPGDRAPERSAPEDRRTYAVPDLTLNVTREQFHAAIARIKGYIAAGDTYQVNYTCHARFAAELDPAEYFLALVRGHPVPYAAYLNLGEAQIISLSPELLLEKRGSILKTKPMKGTRKRGRTAQEDAALREELTSSLKDRAENLMIVDMMRNDLGRICEIGSVEVPVLFEAEKYRTVWQMTTTVTGRLREGTSLREIMAATLPGSSVTGAPKKRTMEIIRELEPEPRGVYCGAIGVLTPDGNFTFNLPIRTLVHRQGQFDLGIGSGIVWDSDPQGEYEETLLKSQFARRLMPDLRLFETMLVNEGHHTHFHTEMRMVSLICQHLQRLQASADYWGFPFDRVDAERQLHDFCATLTPPMIVRLELDQEGGLHFTSRPLPPPPAPPMRVLISEQRTDSENRLLYHKTNQRALYDFGRERATQDGYFELLFRNERGNLTEGAITNLFARIDGQWLTPPVLEGLLPGIWRARFMRETGAREEPITPEMLAEAEAVVIGNSVRGAIEVGEVSAEGRVVYSR